ncbi:tetratricopeptide repeat protein [Afipia sp. TerB]
MASMAAIDPRIAGRLWPRVRAAARTLRLYARCSASAVLIGAVLALPAPSRAEPARGEATLSSPGKYARLLLTFNQEVPTEVAIAGSILVVRFDQPVDMDIDQLTNAVPSYVGSARRDPDGSAIRLALAQKVRVNVMTAGERVFIDLLPESWSGLPPPLPQEVVRELSERALAAERALRLQRAAEEAKKKPPVRVRASVQPTFVRFVFELPDGIAVSSSLSVDKFSLSFSSPLTFDLADAKVAAPNNIKSIAQKISGDSSSVEISLIGEVDVHAFREDRDYVVDIGFEKAQKSSINLPAIATPAVAAKNVIGTQPKPPTSESIAKEAKVAIAPQGDAGKPQDAKPQDAKPQDTKPAGHAEARPAPTTVAAKPEPAAAAPAAVPAAPVAVTPAVSVPAATAPAAKPASDAVVVEAARTSEDFRLTFPFGAATPLAVFRRADAIWVVFATGKPLDISAVRHEGGSLLADATLADMPNGRALRIRLNRPQLVSLTGDPAKPVLTMSDTDEASTQPLVALRNISDPGKENVSIALDKPGPVLRFTDPGAGDTLIVVPATLPARGFVRRQNFVELALLESVHGIVVKPNSDDIAVTLSAGAVTLGRPGGLTLSASNARAERATVVVGPAFDVNEWQDNRKANFNQRLDELIRAAAGTKGDDQVLAHLTLARFYLARGFYPEARGVLDLAKALSDGSEGEAALIARSVADTLSGRPAEGLKALSTPEAGNSPESQLWRALANARLGKWADAREKFKNVEPVIIGLPVDLQRIVLMDSMRALLEVKDYSGATARSNELEMIGVAPEQKAELTLLRGRLADALGQDKDALAYFHDAAESDDRPVAVKAKLYEIALRQKRNEIGNDDALRELETLAVIWRGDATEMKTLEMLARLYGEKGRYSEAFAATHVVTRIAPNSEIARAMQDDASALFSNLYLTSKGDSLPPIEALAMFYEYRDLAPIGRRGDEMIRRLADRLVAFDLLDQAGELLQYQIDHRLEGAARAQVAARLATIYLMNRKPSRAIAALRTTRIADLAGELRQQRLLLEARAQSDIGRRDMALDIISNLTGREAIRLRSDIYWAARRWRESAEQIELLYGERWRDFKPLTDLEKSDIIRAAIGYALAEDAIGLARFREKYAPKMENASDRSAFAIASKPASADSADFAKIAKMAATIDTLDGFLREMRVRFPDAVARVKLPASGVDTEATGTLPAIIGTKQVKAER